MTTANLSSFYSSVPIGGVIPVSNAMSTVGSNFLKADGGDITAASYPAIASNLLPATSAAIRGVFGTSQNFSGVAYGNGMYVAIPFITPFSTTRYSGWYATSTDGTNWVQQNMRSLPAIVGYYMSAISFLNGKFYIAAHGYGLSNYIFSSTDGVNWSQVMATTQYASTNTGDPNYYIVDARICSISYVNGVYFAPSWTSAAPLGQTLDGYYTSTDGITWTPRASPIGYGISISYGAGVYVMVGSNGATYSSTNYTSWTVRTNTATGSGGWACVCFGVGASVNGGAGAFVSCQGITGAGTSIGYSTDGITWQQRTVPSGRYYRVIYANGIFIAVGETTAGVGGKCVTSTDGLTWTSQTMPTGSWYDVAYNAAGGFVAVGNGTARNYSAKSTDGVTWTMQPLNDPTNIVDSCYGTGLGYMTVTATGITSTSTDGNTWTQRTSLPAALSVTCNPSGSIYVACTNSSGAIYSTTDGITWTSRFGGVTSAGSTPRVRWCNDKFIVVVSYGTLTAGGGRVAYSYDGITWTFSDASVITADGSTNQFGLQYLDVVYGNGMYVIVGADSYNAAGYGINGFDTNMSAWSNDGIVWNMTQNMPTKSMWTGCAYGNGVFVAVSKHARNTVGNGAISLYNATYGGYAGYNYQGETTGRLGRECAVSTNGIDWVSSLLPFAAEWSSVTFNGRMFIAVAAYAKDYAVSKDGYNWTIRPGAVQGFWNNICAGPNYEALAVSGSGAVPTITSSAITPVNIPSVALKITESATQVTLPYIRPSDGINYAVRVK